MNPNRNVKATVKDLLDRLLDRGLVLNTDVIIHVAGVPLLGIKLGAILAGMQTMLDHGIWQDWDEAQRLTAAAERNKKRNAIEFEADEKVLIKAFSTIREMRNRNEIYKPWRAGQLLLTSTRIVMFRRNPAETLFSRKYEEIESVLLSVIEEEGGNKEIVEVHCKESICVQIRVMDIPSKEIVSGVRMMKNNCDMADT